MNAHSAGERQTRTHFEHHGQNLAATTPPAGGACPAAKRRGGRTSSLYAALSAALLSACTLTQSLDEYSSGDPGASQGNANKSADGQGRRHTAARRGVSG